MDIPEKIEKFISLYSIYKNNIKSLYDSYYHEYESYTSIGTPEDSTYHNPKMKYILDNFGVYFPVYKIDSTRYTSIKELYGYSLPIMDKKVLHINLCDGPKPLLLIPKVNDKVNTIAYNGIKVEICNSINTASVIVNIMETIETTLAFLINDNIDEFIHYICGRYGSQLYPYNLIDPKYSKIYTSIQFHTLDDKIKHFTVIPPSVSLSKFEYLSMYDQFDKIVGHLMNYIDYKILKGDEEMDHLFRGDSYREIWREIDWNQLTMTRSMLDGMYLPMTYIHHLNSDILTDGIHRFLCLKDMCMNDIYHKKALALCMSYKNRDISKDNITITIYKFLYDNNTWTYKGDNIVNSNDIIYEIAIQDIDELISYFYLLERELNNFIDNGIFEKYHIEPSEIINIG